MQVLRLRCALLRMTTVIFGQGDSYDPRSQERDLGIHVLDSSIGRRGARPIGALLRS